MAIRFAFSTVGVPDWSLHDVLEHAESWGYQGVELRTLGAGSSQIASDPALIDPAKAGDMFASFSVEPVCLSTSIALHGSSYAQLRQKVSETAAAIDLASELGCRYVRVFGPQQASGADRRTAIRRLAETLDELVNRAADAGVELLLENAGAFNQAKEWWWLFNQNDHPMAGMLWNVANAAASGEGPAVSVPVLNHRLRMAKVKDTRIGEGIGWLPLGEGDVEIEHLLRRLMGIGFDGYVSVEWDRAWMPTLDEGQTMLPAALETMRGWVEAIHEATEVGEKKLAKEAAKNAPKKRSELAAG